MNSKQPSAVNVTVSGHDPLAVRAVAATVGDALSDSGFTDVRVASLNREPNQNSYLESSATVLDVIRRQRPELLASPVIVEYMHTEGTEQPERDLLSERDLAPALATHAHQPSEGDEVLGAEVPLSPAQEQEQEFDIASEVTGNLGAVDGDPVAADPEDA